MRRANPGPTIARPWSRSGSGSSAEAVLAEFFAEPGREVGAIEAECDIGGEEAEFRAAIVGDAVEANAVERLLGAQSDHAVGQLDFAPSPLLAAFEDREDFRLQDVAPGDDEVRWRRTLSRLLHHSRDLEGATVVLPDGDHPILVGLLRCDLFDRDDIVAVAVVGLHTLLETAGALGLAFRHHVRQQDGEGLVADDLARAPDRVSEPEGRLLAGETRRAGRRQIGHQRLIFLRLPPPLESLLEFVGGVEMVLDDALVSAGDKDEMLDSGLARLVHDVLKDRPIDDGQHLLRNGLGSRQKTRAEPRDRQDGFANRLLHRRAVLHEEKRDGVPENLLSLKARPETRWGA